MSERTVGEKFDEIFKNNSSRRIIVATFSSNIHRIQQIVNAAVKTKRKVAVSGRSMQNVLDVAKELGYIHMPEGTLVGLDDIGRYRPGQLVIVTTGSQGEPMSALSRMAFSDHKKVELGKGDLVILSSNPIPGNEKSVSRIINELLRKEVDVIYESLAEVHVSGHACSEELKIILGLTKPKFFMPVHGEHRHLVRHESLALMMGMNKRNIVIAETGSIIELDQKSCAVTGQAPSGNVLVDGYGVGDVGSVVLRDRKHLGQDGIIVVIVGISRADGTVVSGPDIISRGFVYVRESEDLIDRVKMCVTDAVEASLGKGNPDHNSIKNNVRNRLADFLYDTTKRKPMILPVIMEN